MTLRELLHMKDHQDNGKKSFARSCLSHPLRTVGFCIEKYWTTAFVIAEWVLIVCTVIGNCYTALSYNTMLTGFPLSTMHLFSTISGAFWVFNVFMIWMVGKTIMKAKEKTK